LLRGSVSRRRNALNRLAGDEVGVLPILVDTLVRTSVKATGDFPPMDTWEVALVAGEAGDHGPLNPPQLSAKIAAMAGRNRHGGVSHGQQQ
jgi:hypothetical protein